MCTYVRTYLQYAHKESIRTYARTHVRTYVRMCARAHVCVNADVRARARTGARNDARRRRRGRSFFQPWHSFPQDCAGDRKAWLIACSAVRSSPQSSGTSASDNTSGGGTSASDNTSRLGLKCFGSAGGHWSKTPCGNLSRPSHLERHIMPCTNVFSST